MAITARPTPPVRTHDGALHDASVGELTARLTEQVSRLVRDELHLAELEAKRKAKRLGVGVGMFGAGGGLAAFGLGCAVAAAVLGIANVLQAWLAALIVAGALFVAAGLLALIGKAGVKRGTPPVPTEAVRNAKADVAAVREAVRR